MRTIETEAYLIALQIVNVYHEEIRKEALEVAEMLGASKIQNKNKESMQTGDFVECIDVHGNSIDNLTKGKEYEVVNFRIGHRDRYFTIITNKGQKREYNCKNAQFKAI